MTRTPKYCLHRSTNRAFVTLDGERIYLGKYESPESRDAYDEAILKWRRLRDRSGRLTTTISQLSLAFLKHAEKFYVHPDGQPTGETDNFRYALKPLVRMYRNLPCSEFSPLKLKNVRADLIKRHVRIQVNRHIHRIRHVFRWGVENEMLPGSVVTDLDCLKALGRGRGEARESEDVKPVPQADIDAIIDSVTRPVRAMIHLQLLTGARPSEIRMMMVGDVDTSEAIWTYRPGSHKNAWRGKGRTIFIGPRAQDVLRPFIADSVRRDQFVFRPKDKVNKEYTLAGYISGIRRVCLQKQIPVWSPGRLRHNAATNIRREFGDVEAARVVLGHSEKSTTQIYAEQDLAAARAVVAKIG